MNSMIANLINGNLSEAKRQAASYSETAIFQALRERVGWSVGKATLGAAWLKGRDCWQKFCDAK
jgi:hypothetical protein